MTELTMIDNKKMIDQLYDFFLSHRAMLVKKYYQQFIIIVNNIVTDSYPSFNEAYHAALKKHDAGTFLIQQCVPQDEEEVIYIRTCKLFSKQSSTYE